MMKNAAISTGKIVFYFLLLGLFTTGLVEVGLPMLGLNLDAATSTPKVLILGVINFLVMSLPAMLLMAVFDRKSPVAMGLAPKSSIADFLTGGVVGGFIFLSAVAAAFFGGWATFNPDVSKFSMSAMALSMLGMTLGAAGEEVMMRGYVLQELMSKFSTTASVVVSSLIFTALHAGALLKSDMAPIGALNIFLASVLLSLAYLGTRTLWLPIGIHTGWNIMQGPVLGFNVSGNDFGTGLHPVAVNGPDMVTGGIFGFEGSVLGLIGPTLGILMMVAARKRA